MQFFIKPIEICLIVCYTISWLLIDYFYKNRLISFKEIINYKKINHVSLQKCKYDLLGS